MNILIDRHQPKNRDGDRELVRWESRRRRPSKAVGAVERKGVKFFPKLFLFLQQGVCGWFSGWAPVRNQTVWIPSFLFRRLIWRVFLLHAFMHACRYK